MDGKHIWYYFQDSQGEDSSVKMMMSHGVFGETIGAPLISQMARQLRLTKTQFLDFIDCTVSETDYRDILREQDETV